MIHKIHTGEELTTDFTVMGHNQSVNNYNEVGYVGDRRDCEQCHLPGTYNLPLPEGTICAGVAAGLHEPDAADFGRLPLVPYDQGSGGACGRDDLADTGRIVRGVSWSER